MIDRDELVAALARISHGTHIRQVERAGRANEYGPDPTDHDFERAEDIVRELERIGVYIQSHAGGTDAAP